MLERAAAVADSLPFLLSLPSLFLSCFSPFTMFVASSTLPTRRSRYTTTPFPRLENPRSALPPPLPCPRLSDYSATKEDKAAEKYKYSPGRKRATPATRRGGQLSNFWWRIIFFSRSPTRSFFFPPFFLSGRKILSRFMRFCRIPLVASTNELLLSLLNFWFFLSFLVILFPWNLKFRWIFS